MKYFCRIHGRKMEEAPLCAEITPARVRTDFAYPHCAAVKQFWNEFSFLRPKDREKILRRVAQIDRREWRKKMREYGQNKQETN